MLSTTGLDPLGLSVSDVADLRIFVDCIALTGSAFSVSSSTVGRLNLVVLDGSLLLGISRMRNLAKIAWLNGDRFYLITLWGVQLLDVRPHIFEIELGLCRFMSPFSNA